MVLYLIASHLTYQKAICKLKIRLGLNHLYHVHHYFSSPRPLKLLMGFSTPKLAPQPSSPPQHQSKATVI